MIVHPIDKAIIHYLHRRVEKKGRRLSEYERAVQNAERRRKQRTFIFILLLIGIVVGIAWYIYASWIRLANEYEEEVETLSQAQVGDVVTFGRYDTNPMSIGTERLPW